MKPRLPTYAGRLERLFANLIDTLILIIPNGLLIHLIGAEGLATIFTFLAILAYYVYFTASPWQATPGKRMLGIYVVRTDGRPLARRDALERFLAYSIPSLPMYASFLSPEWVSTLAVSLSLFWFAPILFTEERIGYHDRLCGTRVVVGRIEV